MNSQCSYTRVSKAWRSRYKHEGCFGFRHFPGIINPLFDFNCTGNNLCKTIAWKWCHKMLLWRKAFVFLNCPHLVRSYTFFVSSDQPMSHLNVYLWRAPGISPDQHSCYICWLLRRYSKWFGQWCISLWNK